MTHRQCKHSDVQAGFSLVELLIVVFIIGLMSSVAVMTLPEGRSPAVRATDDIAKVLHLMSRESVLLGEPVRWRHSSQTDMFEHYRLGEWTPIYAKVSVYERFSLDNEIDLEIALLDFAGKQLKGAKNDSSSGSADRVYPPIVFLPTGEATAAAIHIRDSKNALTISLGYDGQFTRSDMDGRHVVHR